MSIKNYLQKKEVYDYIIVGGGISGLYTAYKLLLKNPKTKICIIESSNILGGRLKTIHKDNMTFDAGGARFNKYHHRMLKLIKELNLNNKMKKISNESIYISINPNYNKELETIFPTIDNFINDAIKYIKNNNITKDELNSYTIIDFANKYYEKKYPTIGKYLIARYPYYSELAILNANVGFDLFQNEFSAKMQYYILEGGLDQLIKNLYNKINNKITIKLNTKLNKILSHDKGFYKIECITTDNPEAVKLIIYSCNNLILALPQNALMKIDYLTHDKYVNSLINSISSEPLYRIYARYPKDKSGNVWFNQYPLSHKIKQLPKINTNLQIKYIIPMDYKNGLVMISYTDSKYAKYWLNTIRNNE